MAEPSALETEIALLAAPIEGAAPAGADPREDFTAQSVYYRLRDARAEARAAERAGDTDTGGEFVPPPQWKQVRDLAVKALSETAKDLEIAAWLTESLIRSEGVQGLAAGAGLIANLADAFWDQGLFPMPDEDGIATRVAPVTGLNGEGGDGTVIQPLRRQTLFRRPDGTPVAFFQYQQSEQLQGLADPARVKQRIAAGIRPFGDTEKDARAAGAAHFARLRTQVKAAIAAWTRMAEIMDAKAGADSPPTGRVRDLLEAMRAIVNRYAPPEVEDAPEDGAAADEAQAADGEPGPGGAHAGPSAAKAVTRDDMLKELARIAEFFRRTEPHSPISYALDDAVRRGKMTWPELLAEVVPDEKARGSILINLGIWPAKPDGAP